MTTHYPRATRLALAFGMGILAEYRYQHANRCPRPHQPHCTACLSIARENADWRYDRHATEALARLGLWAIEL